MSATAARSRLRALKKAWRSIVRVLPLMAAFACRETQLSTHTAVRYAAAAPADVGQVCSDIAAARVCWTDSGSVIVPRTVPEGAAPPHGWRCGGAARERSCEDRNRNASVFNCSGQRCVQTRPRMPDDGEWECVEISGVVFCHSRGSAAGVAAGPMDLGWRCGARRGGAAGERVCVDLDADRPSEGASQRCRFELDFGTQQRSCTPDRASIVGSACDAAHPCSAGIQCSAGLCLPARLEPACWLDRDCGAAARCVFGSCVQG